MSFTALAVGAGGAAAQPVTKVPVPANPVPVFERIEPTAGPVGTQIEIVGRRFHPGGQMFLGDVQLTVVRQLPNRVTVTIPPNAVTGRINYRQTRRGQSLRTDGPEFRVTVAPAGPIVERFEPLQAVPGAEVTIHGRNFSPRMTDNVVKLGARPAVVRSATPFALRVTVPDGAVTAPWFVRVGTAGEARSTANFTVLPGLAITDFQPRIGPPGTRVTITGTGFNPAVRQNRVFMNNVPVRVESATATQLVVSIPAAGATGPLVIDIRGGGRGQTPAPFTIQFAPTIASFDPTAGPVGHNVRIRGTNFGTDIRQVQVTLAGRPVTVRNITATELAIELPAGAATGRFAVTVNGLGPVQAARDFVVVVPTRIADFQPRSGPGNTTVVITGEGFSARAEDNRVTIGPVRCTVLAATPTELRVRVPTAPSDRLTVAVSHNRSASTTEPFVLTTPPTITRVGPPLGPVGTVVRIVGTGFGNRSMVEVKLGEIPMELRSVSNEHIDAVIPANAVTGRITVTVRMQGVATSPAPFEVVAPFEVASITPTQGLVGAVITVRGQGFSQTGMTALFPGVRRPVTPAWVSATEVRLSIPTGAQSGPVRLRLRAGREVSTPALTVLPPPAGVGVTGVEPRCTYPGCVVIIRGWGFAPSIRQNRVTFGGRPVRVVRATPVELELNLPAVPPQTGPIAIDVRNVGTAATAPFTMTAAPGAAAPAAGATPAATPAPGTTTTTTTTTVRRTTTTTTTTPPRPATGTVRVRPPTTPAPAQPTPSVTPVPAR